MQPGDLVYDSYGFMDEPLGPVMNRPVGIIIGKIKSNMSAWVGNPHAAQVAAGNPDLYYVFYSDGRFEGPVPGDNLVAAG